MSLNETSLRDLFVVFSNLRCVKQLWLSWIKQRKMSIFLRNINLKKSKLRLKWCGFHKHPPVLESAMLPLPIFSISQPSDYKVFMDLWCRTAEYIATNVIIDSKHEASRISIYILKALRRCNYNNISETHTEQFELNTSNEQAYRFHNIIIQTCDWITEQ